MGTVFSSEGWDGVKWPLLVTGIALIIVKFFGDWLLSKLTECFPSLEIGDIELNESIGEYWECLDAEDRKWSLAEEANSRDPLKMKILTDEQYERL